MGYQNQTVGNNLNMMMPDFVAIDEEGIDIQKLIPVVPEGQTLASGDFVIQFYDQYGVIEKSYYYLLAPDTDAEEKDGWWDDGDGVVYSTKKFGQGEGFILYAKKGGTVTYSGEVEGSEFGAIARTNLSHQGNPRPCKVAIQTVLPEVPEGKTLASGDFVIQYYDQYGIIAKSYYYLLAPDTDAEEMDGWWDDGDGVVYSTKEFDPAEGFYVYAKKGGQLVFPTLSF